MADLASSIKRLLETIAKKQAELNNNKGGLVVGGRRSKQQPKNEEKQETIYIKKKVQFEGLPKKQKKAKRAPNEWALFTKQLYNKQKGKMPFSEVLKMASELKKKYPKLSYKELLKKA